MIILNLLNKRNNLINQLLNQLLKQNNKKQTCSQMQRSLIVFIVGTTAVGKTKLSIQLCKALGGEVINCDSKQLYKYADIMTAKASPQQIQGIPHHMLDVLDLNQNCYNRNKYFTQAMKCVEDIKARGKIPVIVGGTNYYLQTLLYDLDMTDPSEKSNNQNLNDNSPQITKKQDSSSINRITKQQILLMTREQRYAQLQKVDPLMATKLHKNDQARITNFLSRYAQTGIPPSSNYKPMLHRLRFADSVLFWIRNSNKTQLHQLMENRVNKMVEHQGLIQIMTIFKYMDIRGLLNQNKMGVIQSIGYKQYLDAYYEVKQLLSGKQIEDVQNIYQQIEAYITKNLSQIKQKLQLIQKKSVRTSKNTSLLHYCKQILIKNTIDYSKRQVTWLRNRIFACQDNRSNFFVLQLANKFIKANQIGNADLINRFQHNVKNRALEILNKIRQDGVGSVKQEIKQFTAIKHESIIQWKKYYCQQCQVEVNGSREWTQHLRSRKHHQNSHKKSKTNIMKEKKLQKQKQENQKNQQGLSQSQQNQKKSNKSQKNESSDSEQQNNNVSKKKNKQNK